LGFNNTSENDGPTAVGQQFTHNVNTVLRRLARPINGFGYPGAQGPMVVDKRITHFRKGEAAQLGYCFVG
jgi:hypothetical protein